MLSSVTKRGQTVIPADPISTMRGRGKGEHIFEQVLVDRCEELEREG